MQNSNYRLLPWFIWIISASIFFVEYLVRTSPLAMIRELTETFNASSLEISALSAYFLYAYIAMQVPVGLIVDRYGAKITLTLSTGLCAIATLVFSYTGNIYVAQASRFVLGFAASFTFVSSLKLASQWFKPSIFAILVGCTQALGMVGGAAGASITSRMLEKYSWQDTIFFYSILLGIMTLLAFVVIKSKSNNEDDAPKDDVWHNVVTIIKHPQTWFISLLGGFLFAPTQTFAESWGSYFLIESHGLAKTLANDAIATIYIGWAIGGPLIGGIANVLGRKPVMRISSILCAILMPILILSPNLSTTTIYALFFAYGLSNSGVIAAYTAAAEVHPKHMNGAALGLANGMSVMVGAILIQLIGLMQDLIRTSNEALTGADLRWIMSINICSVIVAIFLSFFVKETYKKAS